MRRTISYLTDCERHKKSRENLNLTLCKYDDSPEFKSPPTPKWFLATYIHDIWARLPWLKSKATSIYGTILKIDSKKKITQKLQVNICHYLYLRAYTNWSIIFFLGKGAKYASWCTNVGNERGEILISLMTTSESLSNLSRMADELMDRYANAIQPDPFVLYTDPDCCKVGEESKFQRLFHRWENLVVRVDSWHFMRRMAKASTNESHPLYGTFMSKQSGAIFEWDQENMNLLRKAKRGQLVLAGIKNLSLDAVNKSITKNELAKHCKRRTRGSVETVQLIDHLFLSLQHATDTLGVPLLLEEVIEI